MKPKSLKKSSHQDQDRSRSKKSKSEKRKRRYSSSDLSDTGRKKPRKSKESKKKKKLRRISPSSTSSSYSSDNSVSSCSTCEKQKPSRSRSPISRGNRKSKPRKGRISTSSKYKGRERGRSHKRSRSCSTCSSSSSPSPKRSRSASRSRSPTRSKIYPKEKGKVEKGQVSSRVESDSEERDKAITAYDDIVSSSKNEEKEMQRQSEESEQIAEASGIVVSEKTQHDSTKRPPVVDAELILRQKALENFIRFHKVKKCGIREERQGSVSNEPNKNVGSPQGAMATETVREGPVLQEPSKVITDMALKGKREIIPNILRPKIRSVIVIPENREVSEDNTAVDPYNTGEVSSCITGVPNHVEDEPSKWSELNPNPNPNPSASVVSGLENNEARHETTSVRVETGGGQYENKTFSNPNPNPSASVVSGLEKNEARHETTSVRVETGRGQYENKTFSRMHDGEMVQVSYKVYIPKKTPALARRKLQRGETSTSQI